MNKNKSAVPFTAFGAFGITPSVRQSPTLPTVTPSAAPNIDLIVHDGKPATTSVQVAEIFGKEHRNVLRDIRQLLDQDDDGFAALNFALISYTSDLGNGITRNNPAYVMSRDGLTLLVMGYTGKEAMRRKKAYIAAFNAMESELNALHTTSSNRTRQHEDKMILEAMQTLVARNDRLEHTVQELASSVDELAPKAAYHDAYLAQDGLLSLTDAAKQFGMSARQLGAYLRETKGGHQWLFHDEDARNLPLRRIIDQGLMVVKGRVASVSNRFCVQAMFTPKGMQRLAALLDRDGILYA